MTIDTTPLTIDSRYNGPPASGNGGYTCGALASRLGGTVEVRLHQPPPLAHPMEVRATADSLSAFAAGTQIATARPAQLRMDIPEPPSADEARRAADRPEATAHHDRHPFPTCFVCGPERRAGDGLRLFPGPVEGRDIWTTPWTPEDELGDEKGILSAGIVWAALDCPSAAPFMDGRTIVLGTLTARRLEAVHAGRPYVVASWPIAVEGRKQTSGVALFDEDDALIAAARAIWIEIR